MKKLISLTIVALLASLSSKAQDKNPVGTWKGMLNAGRQLTVVFNIKEENKKLSATMDSPDQQVMDIACSDVYVKGDSLYILLDKFKSSYTGKFEADGSVAGVWSQGPAKFNLILKRGEKVAGPKRPQTPVAPFAYKSEDVIYHNKDKSIQYGATITIPNGNAPFPAIIMSTGSGSQNRDEELMGHRPFAVIADYLTKKGYIVLRVDDQGIGKTTGHPETATTADFAKDALNGIEYLKSRKETDKKKLGVMGHSEGGLIAQMVAAQSKDVNFIVLLAGPGINIINLMEEQNVPILKQAHLSQEAIDAYLPLYNEVATIAVNAKGHNEAAEQIKTALTNWKAKTHPNIALAMGMNTDEGVDEMVKEFTGLYDAPWWRYFMSEDPAKYLEKLNCKVLALNGDKDQQVISESNLAGMKQSLAKSKSPKYDVIEMKGLNHLFQKCNSCTIQEYGKLEETFSPDALAVIGDWLDKNVK
jgi:pimeloyl-ACP methyl ester carboxylesterase